MGTIRGRRAAAVRHDNVDDRHGTTRRKTRFSVPLDEDNDEDENQIIYYCDRCASLGYLRILGERIYLPVRDEETGAWMAAEKRPDHYSWLQCRTCGSLYIKKELHRLKSKWPGIDTPGVAITLEEQEGKFYDPQKELLKNSYGWLSKDKKKAFLKKINASKKERKQVSR